VALCELRIERRGEDFHIGTFQNPGLYSRIACYARTTAYMKNLIVYIQQHTKLILRNMYPFFLNSGGHASTPLWTAKGRRHTHQP
jgi:hypothetical protein